MRTQDTQVTPVDPLLGRGYERLEELGRGTFGFALKVKRMQEPRVGSLFVAKMQKFKHLNKDELEYLDREVENMRVIKHPHIVRFRESFVTEMHLCIVMDLCEGGDLQEKIATQKGLRTQMKEEKVVEWLLQLVTALDYLHNEIKCMHRDIKPANIFLHRGKIKLGDMGLSKYVSEGVSKPGNHTACGSPLYLAPEVHMGQPDEHGDVGYTCSVDIWALGCTLYEMMMLEKAFTGKTKVDVLNNVINARFGDISGQWSAELFDMVEAMLDRVPARRPKTTKMLHSALFGPLLDENKDGIMTEALHHRGGNMLF